MVQTRSSTDIYGDVNTLADMREINRKIREEMRRVRTREQLTELKKRSDYLCALTLSPSWKKRFGEKSPRFLEVAREESAKTAKLANEIARQKGWDADYDPWGGE
jgi:hypothetical protein